MSTPIHQGSIEERVKKIVGDQFCRAPAEINQTASLVLEYGMTDIDLIEITMSTEDEFGIEIDDDTMYGIKTIQDVIDVVTQKVVA
ncbi:MAG: acyl carrier protein [Paraburkholderia tropica]|nr:acyl carrier protein [Paraburkholderia tropica]